MPLPEADSPWPLPGISNRQRAEMAEHAAWYSGDPEELKRTYGKSQGIRPSERVNGGGGVVGGIKKFFWGTQGINDPMGNRLQVHVPLAGNIATTSADFLFSESPTISIPEVDGEERTEEDGRGDNASKSEAVVTQDRLEQIVEEGGLGNTFLEMAEITAAIGGAYLRPVWDREIVDRPMLTVVSQDQAVPDFRFGILTGVTFWEEVERNGQEVWRYVERHEAGVVLIGLYVGTDEKLGRKVSLDDHKHTKALADSVTDGEIITVDGWTEDNGLFVRYVPNIRPNRRHRGYLGRSDFQGIESLFDALDQVYTSWIRDIRIGQARILVNQQYLQRTLAKPEEGASFDVDQDVFTSLNMPPTDDNTPGITDVQFEIRAEQHNDTAQAIIREAVSVAGYSPQTFIPKFEGAAESGAALRIRERKSLTTRGKKERYVKTPIEDVLEIMLFLDKAVFGGNAQVLRPRLQCADSVADAPKELAETAAAMRNAQAASTQTRVAMLHPDWADQEIEAEAAMILEQEGMSVPLVLPGEIEG